MTAPMPRLVSVDERLVAALEGRQHEQACQGLGAAGVAAMDAEIDEKVQHDTSVVAVLALTPDALLLAGVAEYGGAVYRW